MALALFLRSSPKFNSSAFLLNVSRLSTTAATSQIGQPKRFTVNDDKNKTLSSLMFNQNSTPNFNTVIRGISLSTPKQSSSTSNHTALWTAEKVLSASLLAVIPAAFLYPCQPLDALLAVSIVIHQHWGLEALVTDYLRPAWFGNAAPKIGHALLLLISAGTLGGLLYFIYTDIGIAKAVKKIWAIKGQ